MAGVYQIRVEGHLDGRWSDWFDDHRLTHHSDGTTALSQAALHGLLAKVRDLNLTLCLLTSVPIPYTINIH